jgi:gamma-glutamylcyclotransferase (GGCT)/AIG2-like uncharacterized protein YtfP
VKIALFVYGSLLQGEELDGYLAGLSPRPARTRGRLYRLPAGYPSLVPTTEDLWVKGELVSLDSMARLRVLDVVEGVGRGLYTREKIPIALQGQTLQAWAYVMRGPQIEAIGGRPIPSGDWRVVSRATRR